MHIEKFRSYELFTCAYPPLVLSAQSKLTYLKSFEENQRPGMTQAKRQDDFSFVVGIFTTFYLFLQNI
jgi:hypothetical protein